MKIRSGFVSNSSSSSFVVIGRSGKFDKAFTIDGDNIILVDDDYFFGWDFTTYNTVEDRIAWAWLQAQYTGRPELLEMIKQAVFEVTGKQLSCNADVDKESYIDHQSVEEGKIFSSMDDLKSFIFDKDSYVKTGNDNV
jgi:hypothetical protein